MAEQLKPSDINKVWASGGDVLTPTDSKITTGWEVEIPPRQFFNWLDNRQDRAISHINQHGVCVWDNVTEYQANKSYVQGPTNGTIYRCVATHAAQNPETDVTNTYWQVAFAGAGDFYSKTETDSKYLSKTQNLSDLPNAATARTNLDVYSKGETYTKAEVDGKTTVASAIQAQEQTSNTTLLSPLRLADAFKGANQSLSTNGYQKIPGGLIIQWFTAAESNNNSTYRSFPITFPNGVLAITGSPNDSAIAAHGGGFTATAWTTSGVVFVVGGGYNDGQTAFVVAIGY